jgi:hypothetical protein
LALYASNTLVGGEALIKHVFTRSITFPTGMTGSRLHAGTAAAASNVFSLRKNGVQFGTITVAASGTTGTFAAASGASFVAGDLIEVVAPATADTTLANVSIALYGTKV